MYKVTNLNDSGAGSFRDAVSQPNRYVVFDVGGVIHISSRVIMSRNITIAGQTAPGEGVVIYGNGVSYSNANDSITRHMRYRMGVGGSSGVDGIAVASGTNMIWDHCSSSWGRDENFQSRHRGRGERRELYDSELSDRAGASFAFVREPDRVEQYEYFPQRVY